jgi:acyl-CoA dehydrogenase
MDFTVDPDITALREAFADFIEREVRPREEALLPTLSQARPDLEPWYEQVNEIVKKSAEAGFYVAYMPSEYGGQDLPTLGMTLLVEDAAASGLRLAMTAIAPPNPAGPTPLLLQLPKHLRDEWIPKLVTGDKTMCFALTEPDAGSDAQSIRTHAVLDGDEWVLNGHKHYITNAKEADVAVVFAVTDAEKRAAGGITALLVPLTDAMRGRTNWNISDTHPGELIFDNVRIPKDHVVGEVGMGFFGAMAFLNAGRAFIGASALGLGEWALRSATDHAKVRTAFGKPLSKFQGVSFPLAQSHAELESVRWLVYRLAWLVDSGVDPLSIMGDASVVKYLATETAYKVADRALQAMGGQGLMREGPVERVLRHLRMLRVVEGASEVQLLIIAKTLGL